MASDTINKVNLIDYAFVSTDHKLIAKEAIRSNIEVPFLRPKYLSGDFISDYQILSYNLKKIEKMKKEIFDIILLIQPTSPLRKSDHISQAIKKIIDGKFDSVWSVSKIDLKFHPDKQLTFDEQLDNLNFATKNGKKIIARQQLKETYYRNGIVYAFTRNCILSQKTILGKNSSAIIIKGNHISIDTNSDLQKVKKLTRF